MKSIFMIFILFIVNSCSLYIGTPDEVGTPISTHIPDMYSSQDITQKIKGTIWKIENDNDHLKDKYLFFDNIEDKYYIMTVEQDTLPKRYPYSYEYIDLQAKPVSRPLYSYYAAIYKEKDSFNQYIGIRLDGGGRNLYFISKRGNLADSEIQAALENKNTGVWKLYY